MWSMVCVPIHLPVQIETEKGIYYYLKQRECWRDLYVRELEDSSCPLCTRIHISIFIFVEVQIMLYSHVNNIF